MKRLFTGAFLVLLMFTFASQVSATKWRTYATATYGTCEVQYQSCDRVLLSFQGCRAGDLRGIFDPFNADCALIFNQAFLNHI